MTLQQIIDQRGRFLEFDLDDCYQGAGEPTVQQQVDSVNWAIRTISLRMNQFDPSITFTLTAGVAMYDITDPTVVGRTVVRPLQVVIDGQILMEASGRDYGVWTYAELQRTNSKWRTDPAGVPSKAVDVGNSNLLLHPKPDTTTAGKSNFIAGFYLAADMTTSQLAESPDLPVWCHEAISFLAAYHSAISMSSESEGWNRLSAYSNEWQAAIENTSRRNMAALQSWGSTDGSYVSDSLWL